MTTTSSFMSNRAWWVSVVVSLRTRVVMLGSACTLTGCVFGEYVVLRLHYRVTGEPALGVVPLRRRIASGAGSERLRRRVVFNLRAPPTAAVFESLGVLHHKVDVVQRRGHGR